MFTIIEKADLLNGINIAMKAIGANATLPILQCLLFEIMEDGIRLTSNNMELCLQTAVIPDSPSMDKVPGSIAIDARVFADIVKKLPNDEVEISADEKSHVTIKSGKSKFTILGQKPEEFPCLPEVKDGDQPYRGRCHI